ncbi:hypothetical protein ACA910_014355 [Epithemia clementina (nom. ined.)]
MHELRLDGYYYTSGVVVRNHYRNNTTTTTTTNTAKSQQFYLLDLDCQRQLAQVRRQFGARSSSSSTQHRTNHTQQTSLYHALSQVPCWKLRLDQLRYWREEQGLPNLFFSNEVMGFRWFAMVRSSTSSNSSNSHSNNVNRIPPHPTHADWTSVRTTLEPWYDIHVVVGYRRYFDWLVSARYHEDRWTPTRPLRNAWPVLDDDNDDDDGPSSQSSPQPPRGGGRGRFLQPVYPNLLDPEQQELPFYPTHKVVQNLLPYLSSSSRSSRSSSTQSRANNGTEPPTTAAAWPRIHILNMHNDGSLRNLRKPLASSSDPDLDHDQQQQDDDEQEETSMVSTLLCRIITNAPHACQRSREKDRAFTTTTEVRPKEEEKEDDDDDKEDDDDDDDDEDEEDDETNHAAKNQQGPAHRKNARSYEEVQDIFYDMIITRAAQRGLFPTTPQLKRHAVALRAKRFHALGYQRWLASSRRRRRQRKPQANSTTTRMMDDHNNNNNESYDPWLPLQCPTLEEAQILLHQTLRMERELERLLRWSHHSRGDGSDSSSSDYDYGSFTTIVFNATMTRQSFYDFVQVKKKLCTVDLDKCLHRDSVWQGFFAALRKNQTRRAPLVPAAATARNGTKSISTTTTNASGRRSSSRSQQ